MTTKYRTKGFIFKKEDRSESDRVFSVFTKDFGRTEIIAKAIRKIASKLKGNIGIFSLSEIEFIQGKNYKTLTDAALINAFKDIFEDPDKTKIIYEIGDVLNNFIKGQEKDENTFNLLDEVFYKLDNCKPKNAVCKLIYYCFIWNFLSLQGYRHEVNVCAACHQNINPYNIYFSNKEGGIICKKCSGLDSKAQKINSDIVKLLRIILKKDWDTLLRLRVEKNSQQMLDKISKDTLAAFCSS